MGFFSWDCKGCNHSIREGAGWMGKAVVQGSDGDTASGAYDGYGRMDGSMGEVSLSDMDGKFALYHKACFRLLDRPAYSGPSRSSRDQGTPAADQYPEPKSRDDLRALNEIADDQRRKEKAQDAHRNACQSEEAHLIGDAGKCLHCRFDTFFVVEKRNTLMIRCPNRDCTKLRPFPPEKVEAWRALAAKYADQPVIWDDRKIGPHFAKVVSLGHEIKGYENELGQNPVEDDYVSRRLESLRERLIAETAKALASEEAEG